MCPLKSVGASHLLASVQQVPTTFIFLIIFIFIKNIIFFLSKLIIIKKTMMKIQKIPWKY